jgi:hypothetical protein
MKSKNRLFSIVGKHWHRIAGALVVLIGFAEFVVGGLTADSGLEMYIFAWATVTGSLWFLFEKAETTISDATRQRLVHALEESDARTLLQSIPSQFAALFDKIFGEKHFSRRCFYLSALASFVASVVVLGLFVATGFGGWSTTPIDSPHDIPGLLTIYHRWPEWGGYSATDAVSFLAAAVYFNLIPDYLSLLETRWLIRWMEKGKGLVKGIAADIAATTVISMASVLLVLAATGFPDGPTSPLDVVTGRSAYSVFFYTAFFTSVWLWLYAASVLLSRLLVKLNDGVGFLLNVTDMEQQPLRALGFVSILLVSGIFLVFLPAVLL